MWSSPQNARLAILQEAIALAHSKRNVPLSHHNRPPLIILISERHEDGNEAASETLRRNFLDSWSSTCYGVGEVLTIQGDTSQKIRESLQNLFDGFSPSEFFPVLMVIHASSDSIITSDLITLKRLGNAWNVRLCVEGPALAMLAQSNRPSDPEECAAAADVMLVDPAAWFGFRMCALVTWHRLLEAPVLTQFQGHYSRLSRSSSVMKDYDETHGLATSPMLNLWTVLSKIGLSSIRKSADTATVLSESLVGALRDSSNVVTTYEGIGCGVRISYALSREDRLLPKEKSTEHVSLVNSLIFASLSEESEALCISLGISSDGSFLQFSPVKLLSAGTFWLPPIDMLTDYAKRIQESVDKYESCRAGSVAFRSCVAKCKEIQLLNSSEEQLELYLSFGAFRIVPTEFGDQWHVHESCAETVEGLTALVSRELTESPCKVSSPQYVVQEEIEQARALAEQFDRNPGRLKSSFIYKAFSRRQSFPHGYDESEPLPFDIFLHSDSKNSFSDFISIEPRGACQPVHAVNQATFAADLMIACVVRVMNLWRAGEITLSLEREDVLGSDLEKTADHDVNNGFVADTVEAGDSADTSSRLKGQSFDQLSLNDPPEAPGSEVSHRTLSSRTEQSTGTFQELSSYREQSTSECNRSTSTRDFNYEVPPSPETLLRTSVDSPASVQGNHNYIFKNILSSSTIERSSKGLRTDEEANSPDCALPPLAKAMNGRIAEVVPKTSDLVSAVDAIPVSQAASKGRWFGSWRTKGLGNRNEGGDDDSGSSSSGEESSRSSHGQTEEQDSLEDDDGDEEQESDSSSSDKEQDDRSSGDESSTNSNHDSANETDDSNETSSSESSDAIHEDVDVLRRERVPEVPSPSQPGPRSRLLSWIRPSAVQSYATQSKQKSKGQKIHGSDSGDSIVSSQSGLDEGNTRHIDSSSDEEDRASCDSTESTLSLRPHGADTLSDDSKSDSSNSEDTVYDEVPQQHDMGRNSEERSQANPSNRGYGFGWFGRAEESCKPNAPRTSRRTVDSETEIAPSSSTSDDDESESLESSDVDRRNHRTPSGIAAKRHESSGDGESSERTYVTKKSVENSNTESDSDNFDSCEGTRPRGTSMRESTETEDDSSSTNDEEESKSKRNSASFFDWMLPSWATTPPKFREPKGPARGINSRLRIPLSSESSTDSESEESYKRQRHARGSKKRITSSRENRSLTASRGSSNRRRAR